MVVVDNTDQTLIQIISFNVFISLITSNFYTSPFQILDNQISCCLQNFVVKCSWPSCSDHYEKNHKLLNKERTLPIKTMGTLICIEKTWKNT